MSQGTMPQELQAGHPAPGARRTSRDDDKLCSLQCCGQLLWAQVAFHHGRCAEVRQVTGHPWGVGYIIESKLSHKVIHLEQHGQRLANASCCAEDCNLGLQRHDTVYGIRQSAQKEPAG